MAYINQINPNQEQSLAQSNVLGEGTSGVAGGGGASATGTQQGASASTAGTPGQWVNVQDILQANPGGGSMKGQIQQSGQSMLEAGRAGVASAQKKAEEQLGQTQAQQYGGQNVFASPDYGQIKSGLNQQYQAQDFGNVFQADPNRQQAFAGLQNQDDPLGALVDFNRGNIDPAASYGQGAQSLDKLILSGDMPFVQNFGQNLAGQYQTDVVDPMEQQRAAAEAQSQQLAGNVAAERGKWSQGLTDFLGGQQQQAQSAYDQMLASEAANKAKMDEYSEQSQNVKDIYGKNYAGDIAPYMKYVDKLGQYYDYSGGTPTMAQANQQALGGQGIGQFNELAGLLYGSGGDQFSQLASGGPAAAPGSWNFNQDKFGADIKAAKARREAISAAKNKTAEAPAPSGTKKDEPTGLERVPYQVGKEAEKAWKGMLKPGK